MRNIKYASLLLYLIVKSSGQPVPLQPESQELLMSEVIRVRRQAGYVYDKPSVSFDLPTRAPTVSTQGPTVDRIQAQMMYYAYPAPKAGGIAVSIGSASGSTAGGTATAPAGASTGYNYEAQTTAGAQPISATDSSQTITGSAGSSGYGYNTPSAETAPLSNVYQASSVGSTQTNVAGSTSSLTASSSGSASGYAYNSPMNLQSSSGAMVDVSTNAPKYLPPISGGGYSNDIASVSSSTGTGASGSAAVALPLDQYLPPINQPNPPSSLAPSGPSVNIGVQTSTGSGPNSNYIPPNGNTAPLPSASLAPSGSSLNIGEHSSTRPGPSYIPPDSAPSPLPATNATPRPFSPAPLSTGYLPPNVNSKAPVQNSPSTPASAYLPPI